MAIAFFGGLFLLFFFPPLDPDLGWQLRCGQEIWNQHTFCSQNTFTVLLSGYNWPNHYWLYQTILWPFYQLTGLTGLTLFNAFLMTASFIFFYKAIKTEPIYKFAAIILIIFLSWGIFGLGIRSQLFSFFWFNLLLFIFNKGRRWLYLTPIIMLLWANTHGGSVILGVLLTLFFYYKKPWLVIVSLGTTLLNPYGINIYFDALRHFAGAIKLSELIAEWVPPSLEIKMIGLIGLIGLIALIKKINLSIVVLFLFLLLSFSARRHIPFYFDLLFFFYLNEVHRLTKIKTGLSKILSLVLILFLLFFSSMRVLPSLSTISSWQNYCDNTNLPYPCKAIEFMKTLPKGNIYNRYEWGGFFIWQLPDYKMFVDGRMPAWPANSAGKVKSPYTIYLETLQNQPGWQETLKQYDIKYLFINPGVFMDLLLRPDPKLYGWQEVYRDKISVIYQKGITKAAYYLLKN